MLKKYKIFIDNTLRSEKLWKLELLSDLVAAGFTIYRIKNHFVKCPKYLFYNGSTYYLRKEYK